MFAPWVQVQNIQWGLFLNFKPEIKAMIYNDSAAFNVALCNQILVNKTAKPPTQEQVSRTLPWLGETAGFGTSMFKLPDA